MGPVPLLLGLAALLCYLFAAGPTFYWLDSSELVASAWGLGVAHPPGHPLAALLGRLVCLLPVGTLAFRVTLASALQAAAATALMAVLCHEILLRYQDKHHRGIPGNRVLVAAASGAALCFGLSYSLWFQAVRAEVYALNVMLVVGAMAATLRWDRTGDNRFLLAASLCVGLGLCNHHFLVLLCLPVALLYVVLAWLARRRRRGPRRPRAARLVIGLVAVGALGLTTLAYLPLRARRAPVVNWGSPTTVGRLAWVVSAQAFHQSLDKAAQETVQHRAAGGLFTLVRGLVWESPLAPLAGLLAAAGLYLLWRRRGTRRVGLLLTGLVASNLASPMIVGLDPLNPDAFGYLCVGLAGLCPGLAVVATAAAAGLQRWAARPAVALAPCLALAALPLWQVRANLPAVDLRDHWAAEESGRQLAQAVPPGALVFTSYFETIFNNWALQLTADLRPDVQVVHRNFISQVGYLEQLAARQPGLAPMAARWKRAGHLVAEDLAQLARQRPVRLEYDLNLHPEVGARLGPAGLTLAFDGSRTPAAQSRHRAAVQRWEEAAGVAGVSPGRLDLETRRAVVWTHYLLALFACEVGLPELASFHQGRAQRVAPRDQRLAALRARCGP